MSVREHVVPRAVASEHTVQFFDEVETRIESVAAFIHAGYQAGEPLFVIARAAHWTQIHAQLEALGVPVRSLIGSGRLIARDAVDTVEALRPRGDIDPRAFERLIGDAVRGLGDGQVVRAYGELGDILAEQREYASVIELEQLWNRLSAQVPLRLMCGYCSAHFVSPSTHPVLTQICRAHSGVHHHDQDQLGAWLVASAGTAAEVLPAG